MAKLQKHTLLLFTGDFERLRALHPGAKPSEIIRTLLNNHIKRVSDATPTPEVTMEAGG